MAKSLDELREALTVLDAKVDQDLAQTAEIIVAVNDLLEKIKAGGDFQVEVDAVTAIITKLTSDNPAVQAAIDAAKPPQP